MSQRIPLILWRVGIAGVATTIAMLLFSIVVARRYPHTYTTLSELQWNTPPGIIAVWFPVIGGEYAVDMFRLKDGLRQRFLNANWKVFFTDAGNAFVYTPPPEEEDTNDHKLYYIQTGEDITTINLKKVGNLTAIHEDPSSTYIVIEYTTEQSRFYCFNERAKLNKDEEQNCTQLGVKGHPESRWNPELKHELILRSPAGTLYTFNPKTSAKKKAPQLISEDRDPKHYTKLLALFDAPLPLNKISPPSGGTRTFGKILNLLMIKEKDNWTFIHIPLRAKVAWLPDGEHLLVKVPNKLAVLQIKDRKWATIFNDQGIGKHQLQFRSGGVDRIL